MSVEEFERQRASACLGGERGGDPLRVGASERAGGNPLGTAGRAETAVFEESELERSAAGGSDDVQRR